MSRTPNMNRQQRRATRAKQPKSGVAVITQSFRDAMGRFYWFVKPEGWTKADGVPWRYVEIHGPFATDAENEGHQRLFLLGPQVTVTAEQLTALADKQSATEH